MASIASSNNLHIDLGERFIKQTYRNRCIIYSANGKQTLSIPVKKNNHSKVNEIRLDHSVDWKQNHWKSIRAAYRSSPFFEYYADDLEFVFFEDQEFLSDFNTSLLKHICNEISLKLDCKFSATYIETSNRDTDYRSILNPKIKRELKFPRYIQTFEIKHGFIPNLSILDLLFHEGPETLNYLKSLQLQRS
jgi:hypothetical protein